MKDFFKQETAEDLINRINQLSPNSQAEWGKMNLAQMLAHANVAFDQVYTDNYPKVGGFKKFILKLLVKPIVVGPKPYKKNSRTAPEFIITDEREFQKEKSKLIDYIKRTQSDGKRYFDNLESTSFGKLTAEEWSNLFYKHLDHHLNQFGA